MSDIFNSSTLKTWSNNLGADNVAISYKNNLSNWTLNSKIVLNSNGWVSVLWSPELTLFVGVEDKGTSRLAQSSNGINWTGTYPGETPGAGL